VNRTNQSTVIKEAINS